LTDLERSNFGFVADHWKREIKDWFTYVVIQELIFGSGKLVNFIIYLLN